MKAGLTELVMILDRSGSMSTRAKETIIGFNHFIEEQKKLPGEARVTYVQFDDHYEVVYQAKDIREVPELTATVYFPRGYTALVDAIGKTIASVGERLSKEREEDRPEKVIVQIVTDGYENASKEYTKEQVRGMIRHQEDVYHWLFTFMGTTFDAVSEAATYGIAAGQAMSFGTGKVGAQAVFTGMSVNTMRARSSPDAASAKMYGTYTVGEKAAAAQEDGDEEEQKKKGNQTWGKSKPPDTDTDQSPSSK